MFNTGVTDADWWVFTHTHSRVYMRSTVVTVSTDLKCSVKKKIYQKNSSRVSEIMISYSAYFSLSAKPISRQLFMTYFTVINKVLGNLGGLFSDKN